MDSLDNLPTTQEKITPDQKAQIEMYTGSVGAGAANNQSGGSKWSDTSKWKLIGLIIVAFLVLANPFSQDLAGVVPYVGEGKLTKTLFLTVVFAIIVTLLVMYM